MRLGIVGNGIVGQATARAYLEHVEVRCYDLMEERRTHSLIEVLNSDIIMLALPTPSKAESLQCDTSYLDQFFSDRYIANQRSCNFVIRSTVPIGYTAKIRKRYGLANLVHSPEFLTARCSFTDAQIPSRNIIGGEPCECRMMLGQLYKARFPAVQTLMMTSDESEAVKLTLNSFFAVKIAFFNEVNTLASMLGLDWHRVMEGVLSDGRVAHSHTNVPGPDGKYGYGGTCLPKDIASLTSIMYDNGLDPEVCKGAIDRNFLDRERKV